MKRNLVGLVLLFGFGRLLAAESVGAPFRLVRNPQDVRAVQSLLNEMEHVDLDQMSPVRIEPFELPSASVDVMRVRLEEVYDIEGIGRDSVELRGWIAVFHDNPKAAPGETNARWGTAVSDTEFVGLHLTGKSKLFGEVQVVLEPAIPSVGQVGKLEMSFVEQLIADQMYRPYREEHSSSAVALASVTTREPDEKTRQQESSKAKGKPAQLSGDAASVKTALSGVLESINEKDPKRMLQFYDKDSSNVFFNSGLGVVSKGADAYVKQLNEVLTQIKSIRATANEDMNIAVSGDLATANVTGRNEVVDLEGQRGVSPWNWTVVLARRDGKWLITHDHLSFGADPSRPMDIRAARSAACRANVAVSVLLPSLDMEMTVEAPVQWYSEVETVPPVGHAASVTFTPTGLISKGRKVGTLTAGVVRFREVVRRVPLLGTRPEEQVAQAGR